MTLMLLVHDTLLIVFLFTRWVTHRLGLHGTTYTIQFHNQTPEISTDYSGILVVRLFF